MALKGRGYHGGKQSAIPASGGKCRRIRNSRPFPATHIQSQTGLHKTLSERKREGRGEKRLSIDPTKI